MPEGLPWRSSCLIVCHDDVISTYDVAMKYDWISQRYYRYVHTFAKSYKGGLDRGGGGKRPRPEQPPKNKQKTKPFEKQSLDGNTPCVPHSCNFRTTKKMVQSNGVYIHTAMSITQNEGSFYTAPVKTRAKTKHDRTAT